LADWRKEKSNLMGDEDHGKNLANLVTLQQLKKKEPVQKAICRLIS